MVLCRDVLRRIRERDQAHRKSDSNRREARSVRVDRHGIYREDRRQANIRKSDNEKSFRSGLPLFRVPVVALYSGVLPYRLLLPRFRSSQSGFW